MSTEMIIKDSLNKILRLSITRRGLSRLYTLKVMVGLGKGWHSSRRIMSKLAKYKVHNNHIFEMARIYPELVEADPNKDEAKIKDEAFNVIFTRIDELIDTVKKALGKE